MEEDFVLCHRAADTYIASVRESEQNRHCEFTTLLQGVLGHGNTPNTSTRSSFEGGGPVKFPVAGTS